MINLIGVHGMDELLLKLMGCENMEVQTPFGSGDAGFFSNQLRLKIFESQSNREKKISVQNGYDLEEIAKVCSSAAVYVNLF